MRDTVGQPARCRQDIAATLGRGHSVCTCGTQEQDSDQNSLTAKQLHR